MNAQKPFHVSNQVGAPVGSRRALLLITIAAVVVDVVAVTAALTGIWNTHFGLRLITCLLLLVLIAGQREVIFGDESALNGSMIVLVAASGAYVGGSPLWVPLTCGLLGGVNWDHVRGFEVRKIAVNAACTTLAAVAASQFARLVFNLGGVPWLGAILAAVVAAGAYWLVDNSAVAIVLTAVDGKPLAIHLRELVRSETLLVPFAWAGFLAGYYALHGVAIWVAALSVFALLAVADVSVISPRTSVLVLPARRIVTFVAVTGLVLGVAIAAVEGGAPPGPTLIEFLVLVSGGSYLVGLLRHQAGPLFVVTTTAAACLVLHSSSPILAPLAIGGAGTAALFVSRRLRWSESERVLICTLTMTGSVAPIAGDLKSSVALLVVAGLVAAVAGLVGWHLAPALELRLKTGPRSWVMALDAVRADLFPCLAIGLIVSLLGWIGIHAGMGALSGALLIASIAVAARAGGRTDSTEDLSDDALTDLVQSALLDLPASRPSSDS